MKYSDLISQISFTNKSISLSTLKAKFDMGFGMSSRCVEPFALEKSFPSISHTGYCLPDNSSARELFEN